MRIVPVLFLATAACADIVARPLSTAPANSSADHPCDAYTDTPVKARAREGRCEVPGKPTFDFLILVNVPETSHYAAGHSFVLTSADLSRAPTPLCAPPCLTVPALADVTGLYETTTAVAISVGSPLPDGQSIPVRAVYLPIGPDDRNEYNKALPLDDLFASSRIVEINQHPTVAYLRSLPVGRWKRGFFPQPPYDAFFPPRIDDVTVKSGGEVVDSVELGSANAGLDEPRTSRDALVTRAEGLDGFTVWLQDPATALRISTLQTLSGTKATPRLDTTGKGTSLSDVVAIVAPPAGAVALPKLVTELIAGSGLQSLDYPTLRTPIALEGQVAASQGPGTAVLLAVPSRVTFSSVSITLPNGNAQPLLEYETNVKTDDRGRFATVVPPGTYDVTVEPFEGTGFATMRKQIVVDDAKPLTLSPLKKTRVSGVAQLTDGRPLAGAEVLAEAEPLASTAAQPTPRPGRARIDADGAFGLDLDQGQYVFTVIPQAGTGFPRVVLRRTVPVDHADLGVLKVPPPTRLQLQFRDPSNVARPLFDARVRIFATPDGATAALEIGSNTTDSSGNVEILLAQAPK